MAAGISLAAPSDASAAAEPKHPTGLSYARAAGAAEAQVDSSGRTYLEFIPEHAKDKGRWSAAFAVGIIGDTTVADYADFAFDKLDGEGGGLTYNLSVSYRWHEFDLKVGRLRFRPQVEIPFMLTLVDDEKLDLAPDFNIGIMLRWRDFPWNRYIYTTVAAGAGMSYATEVWTGDYQRHPGDDDRSQWKFWLPIEASFALARYPQHQLILFIDHQSGGHIFDAGGIDAWGFGYRLLF
jgi:hypothetical protein